MWEIDEDGHDLRKIWVPHITMHIWTLAGLFVQMAQYNWIGDSLLKSSEDEKDRLLVYFIWVWFVPDMNISLQNLNRGESWMLKIQHA